MSETWLIESVCLRSMNAESSAIGFFPSFPESMDTWDTVPEGGEKILRLTFSALLDPVGLLCVYIFNALCTRTGAPSVDTSK